MSTYCGSGTLSWGHRCDLGKALIFSVANREVVDQVGRHYRCIGRNWGSHRDHNWIIAGCHCRRSVFLDRWLRLSRCEFQGKVTKLGRMGFLNKTKYFC